jgi:hypothetical protein
MQKIQLIEDYDNLVENKEEWDLLNLEIDIQPSTLKDEKMVNVQ